VEVLKVNSVIVCGHYACGGVKNAMTHHDFGLLNKWLRHIKDVYRIHQNHIESIADPQARWDRLVELNVTEQVQNLAKTSIIQRAWRYEQRPTLHGWCYDLRTGLLKELALIPPKSRIEDIYRFDWDGDEQPETAESAEIHDLILK
jgi:carbonic anhydrase